SPPPGSRTGPHVSTAGRCARTSTEPLRTGPQPQRRPASGGEDLRGGGPRLTSGSLSSARHEVNHTPPLPGMSKAAAVQRAVLGRLDRALKAVTLRPRGTTSEQRASRAPALRTGRAPG